MNLRLISSTYFYGKTTMKIITSWNINGYRSITGQNSSKRYDSVTKENKLFAYIDKFEPDIIALQETKAHPDQIQENLRSPEGYQAYYASSKIKKGYSGVVTFTKEKPLSVSDSINIPEFDDEGRIIETEFPEFAHFNVYFPNGNTSDERVKYKLAFYDALFKYIKQKYGSGKPVIVSGDYNTAHKEIDLARPNENKNVSGFLPIEREKMDEILDSGYTDSFRMFNKEPNNYTWWSNRARAREHNVGWRLDYHFVSSFASAAVSACKIQSDVPGSDHCPIELQIF